MIDKLREYDVTVYFSLNPLNWRLRVSKSDWHLQADLGPVSILVLW